MEKHGEPSVRGAARGWPRGLAQAAGALLRDRRGHAALILGLVLSTIVVAVGAGMDLGRAYFARQQLSAAASLTCQFAANLSVSQPPGTAAYQGLVNGFLAQALADQKIAWPQTNATPIAFSPTGVASVSLNATVSTSFIVLAGITSVPVATVKPCFAASLPPTTPGSTVVAEGFENTACAGSCYDWYLPTGAVVQPGGGTAINAVNTQPSTIGYTGASGTQWVIMGYCVEIDSVGVIRSSVPQGTHSAELDCDNDHGTAGNSSISTNVYMQAGVYELRWNYASRLDYPNYDPVAICGNSVADTSWANDAISFEGSAVRTNQINVYFDQNTNGSLPTHVTLDGTQTLGGSNLVDTCVYATNWIQRSVKITVTTAGNYWLSFAADGHNDSYGGQIDNIMLCNDACAGAVADNFPTSWIGATLFEDTFESPVNSNGNMGNSFGTSGPSSGWPNSSPSGWGAGPVNQIPYLLSGCPQGGQCLQLGAGANSFISRPFLLMPGYYEVNYDYVSELTFAGLAAACGPTPSSAGIGALSATTAAALNRLTGAGAGSQTEDTDTVGVFMSHALLASTPEVSATLGAATTYDNPDGSTTATPAIAPNAIDLASYDPTQPNPLLDICGYAASPQARSAYILVQKPAYYWLTLAALGASDAFGGQIDDVKLTAIGSPYMSGPPAGAIAIPVPDPQPGSSLGFTGFSIVADPVAP